MNDSLFNEVRGRQERLLKQLGSDLLIVPAEIPRSSIAKFRQGSNFFYLTGFPEYGAVLVLDPTSEGEQVSLFVRENTEKEQVWDGFTTGVDKTSEVYPADKVRHIDEFERFLSGKLQGRRVHYEAVSGHACSEIVDQAIKSQSGEVLSEGAVFDAIVGMRMIKSPLEVEQMRHAIKITGEAHHASMRAGKHYRQEYQIEAEFEYTGKMQGVMHQSFGTIVAAGNRGTCQHYVENSGPIRDQDLVLLDGGMTWNGYCADLTRTFPVSGTFSAIQRDLYEVVLASEKAGIEKVAPGVSMMEIHNHSATILIDGLREIGLIKGDTQEMIKSAEYKRIWPGALCHSLGLDTHDPLLPGYHKGDKPLEPGMLITVEPGFYSQAFDVKIPEEFRGIGIRIEDDVLVTENGYENLSIDTIKEVADVEAMVQQGRA